MLSLSELLEELLRYREAPSTETAKFKNWSHDELCEAIRKTIDTVGESYLKYYQISYVVQGPRDQGVDVLLKDEINVYPEFLIGIQVKSHVEIEDKNNTLSKLLKAGFHDARNHYGSRMDRYYILLCGDADRHRKRISAITTEFAKEPKVRVIGPRHIYTFLTMPETTLFAIIDRFLKSDDFVRKEARSEVRGYNNSEIYFILSCLTWAFEHGTNQLPTDFFGQSPRMLELDGLFGHDTLVKILGKFQDSTLEVYTGEGTTRIRTEDFPAITALYYDIQVRYEEEPDDLFSHLYDFLTI